MTNPRRQEFTDLCRSFSFEDLHELSKLADSVKSDRLLDRNDTKRFDSSFDNLAWIQTAVNTSDGFVVIDCQDESDRARVIIDARTALELAAKLKHYAEDIETARKFADQPSKKKAHAQVVQEIMQELKKTLEGHSAL